MEPFCSDGNGTDNDAIFQHHAENQENEVKQEHGGAQRLVHLPVTGRDGNDDKEKHDEEQHDRAEEPVAADGDRGQAVDGRVHQPRDGKPLETVRQSEREGDRDLPQLSIPSCKYNCECKRRTMAAHPTVMSKMLLPTELDTAMSPIPLRATITLVMRSGMEVPAAKIVRPMISSEMPMVSPT